MKRIMALVIVCACHHGKSESQGVSASCVIMHDGGVVTQCFDEIGANAKKHGEKLCGEMHGEHVYHGDQACPSDGLLASCTKGANSELARVERCYRDVDSCEARCKKASGVFERP